MKKMTTILGLMLITSTLFAADKSVNASADGQIVTKCRLYNPPNDSLAIPAVGEQKFELNGISVEVKETNGCTEECYNLKEISVTKNGVTFSSRSETKERGILFPTLSITENGNKQTVQCLLTRAQ